MGGIPVQEDVDKFSKRKRVHIVVGSPGRLKHLIHDKHIDVSSVRLLILDEADKLMEKCFRADIDYIFSVIPQQKQVIMSSSTYPEASKELIDKFMMNSQHVCPSNSNVLLGVQQNVTFVKYNSNIVNQTSIKYAELLKIITQKQFKQCLIFCNYQARVSELYKLLINDKWPVEQLYGQQEQTDRLGAIKTLKNYQCRILVSTDLAARGIDASNVDLVISFEPPFQWATYLHRIGRAGRYGAYGKALTILSLGKEVQKFQSMLKLVMADSLNIYNLWSNEVVDFKDKNKLSVSTCDDKNNTIKVDNTLKCPIEKRFTNGDTINVLNCILNEHNDIGHIEPENSYDNSENIESFDKLLQSFENDLTETGVETVSYNKIDIDDINVTDFINKLEGGESSPDVQVNSDNDDITNESPVKNKRYNRMHRDTSANIRPNNTDKIKVKNKKIAHKRDNENCQENDDQTYVNSNCQQYEEVAQMKPQSKSTNESHNNIKKYKPQNKASNLSNNHNVTPQCKPSYKQKGTARVNNSDNNRRHYENESHFPDNNTYQGPSTSNRQGPPEGKTKVNNSVNNHKQFENYHASHMHQSHFQHYDTYQGPSTSNQQSYVRSNETPISEGLTYWEWLHQLKMATLQVEHSVYMYEMTRD